MAVLTTNICDHFAPYAGQSIEGISYTFLGKAWWNWRVAGVSDLSWAGQDVSPDLDDYPPKPPGLPNCSAFGPQELNIPVRWRKACAIAGWNEQGGLGSGGIFFF